MRKVQREKRKPVALFLEKVYNSAEIKVGGMFLMVLPLSVTSEYTKKNLLEM